MAEYESSSYKGKSILKHRKIWILANGEIPKNYIIHHINGNKHDNRLINLACLSRKQHGLAHSKTKINIWKNNLYHRSNF